jgi:hypothetical protein
MECRSASTPQQDNHLSNYLLHVEEVALRRGSRSVEGLQTVNNLGCTISVLLNPDRCCPRSFQVGWIMRQPSQEGVCASDRGGDGLLWQTIRLRRRSTIQNAMAYDAAASGYLSIGTMERTKSTRAISEKRTGSSFSRWADGGRGEMEMSRKAFFLCLTAASMLGARAFSQSFVSQYKGVPYHDSRFQGGPPKVPGGVLCAYFAWNRVLLARSRSSLIANNRTGVLPVRLFGWGIIADALAEWDQYRNVGLCLPTMI